MKIALVTSSFLPQVGGAELVIHNLALRWSDQGHEVCVMNNIANEATHVQDKYSVKLFRLLRGSTRFGYHRFPMGYYARIGLGRLLKQFQPDFISAHFGYPAGYWLSRIKPLPKFVVTCHGRELTKFDWGYRNVYKIDKILAEALNKSAGAIAISTHARTLMEELGVAPSNILDIPNGVDLKRFQSKVNIDIRRKLEIPDHALVILSVGREHPQKAYNIGIRAFAKLQTRVPHAYYVIVGRNVEKKWGSLASELDVRKKVIFCEGLYGQELAGIYQQSDIFFSPSIWETLALVVLEAMASGLPEVVTNVSGSQDVIETGHNGFVVEPNQPDEMADALHKLASDENLRKKMGAANLARSRFYGWDYVSRKYLEHVCYKEAQS